MVIENKGKLLKAIGWTTVGVGLYMVALGVGYDVRNFFEDVIQPDDDNIIDADFTIID